MSDERREEPKAEVREEPKAEEPRPAPDASVERGSEPPAPDPRLMKALTSDGSPKDPPKADSDV